MSGELIEDDDITIPCSHPQCAVERQMEYAMEILNEGFNIFINSEDWEVSDTLIRHLQMFRDVLSAILDEDENNPASSGRFVVGEIQFPDIGRHHNESDD
jgi:hypothetical protein